MVDEKLINFTCSYHTALEREIESRGRRLFPHHGEKTEIISIFKDSDGYATFYIPVPNNPEIQHGCNTFDYSQYTLNRICQSLSVHRLQIVSPDIGQPWDQPFEAIKDEEPIPEICAPWIHDDLRSAAISGSLDSLPGMTISPIIHVEKGVRTHIIPARIKIWSPTFDIEILS